MHVGPNDKCITWMVQATRVKGNAGRMHVGVGRSRRLGLIMCRMAPACGNEAFFHAVCALILRGVRGTRGVPWVTAFLEANLGLLAFGFDALCSQLVDGYIAESLIFECPTEFGHNEAFHGGLSGGHFIKALAKKMARDGLYKSACAWGDIFLKVLSCHGHELTDDEIIYLSVSVKGTLVLACRPRGFLRASRYNQMDIARFGVLVLVEVYGAIAPPYSEKLHCHFASLQSKGQAKEQKADMLSFGVQSAEDMLLLVNELSQRATFLSPMVNDELLLALCKATVATALVHLCEVRQLLQAFGAEVICRVLESPCKWRKPVMEALALLQVKGTARECHAVTVTRVAIRSMGIVVPRKELRRGIDTCRAREFLLGVAAAGLSPKALLIGITEWRAMYIGLLTLSACLMKTAKSNVANVKLLEAKPFAAIMSLARSKGIKTQPYKKGKRVTVTKKEIVVTVAFPGLDALE